MAGAGVGFSPAVDVAYTTDPPRAIVTAELAGVDAEDLDLEIQGRKLILSGRRDSPAQDTDVYQQVEIERGSFRRVIELGADVDAGGRPRAATRTGCCVSSCRCSTSRSGGARSRSRAPSRGA